jgi:hypothetical protein
LLLALLCDTVANGLGPWSKGDSEDVRNEAVPQYRYRQAVVIDRQNQVVAFDDHALPGLPAKS